MWFLDVDILSRMLLACLIMAIVSIVTPKIFGKNYVKHILLPADIILIGLVSWKLLAFYGVYTVLTYGFVKILKNTKVFRKTLFVLLCIMCALPFFYTRLTGFLDFLPSIFALVGFSYNMLKAIDALYYTYYTDMEIPFYTYANYILFFPVFTSGPVFRYRDFNKTFENPTEVTGEICEECIKKVIRGFFKKMVALYFVNLVLERVMYTVSFVDNVETRSLNEFTLVSSLIVIGLCYLTLYLDLSGYSDIAIGLGRITGIEVPENFKKPWNSPSFTVFWRNWHVTVSDFIREHIFVVLNGKKLNKFISAVIGFFTMIVMSLWHGFTMPFVVSGVYNGLLLAIENIFGITKSDKKKNPVVFYARCVVVTFLFGINTMLFFFDFDTIGKVLSGLVGSAAELAVFAVICVAAVAVCFVVTKLEKAGKAVKSFSFVLVFVAVFFGIDKYLTYNNPFVGARMFSPNHFEVTQYLHRDEETWDKVLYGNSVVISGYLEHLSQSGYVNLGIDYGVVTDLEAMLEEGFVDVGSELAIGLNFLTLYDDFDTNPNYIWHKKWYQPFLYFQRDKITGYINSVQTRIKRNNPHPFENYYNYYNPADFGESLKGMDYKNNLSPEQLAEKDVIYNEKFYNLPDSAFDDNIRALGEVVEFCKENDIEVFVFWMPWNPAARYPELCDRLKSRVADKLEGTGVEIYDLTDALEAEYFHDIGHIEYNNGAPVFTRKFDELVESRKTVIEGNGENEE